MGGEGRQKGRGSGQENGQERGQEGYADQPGPAPLHQQLMVTINPTWFDLLAYVPGCFLFVKYFAPHLREIIEVYLPKVLAW